MRVIVLVLVMFMSLFMWRSGKPIESDSMYKISESCEYRDVVSAIREPMLNGTYRWIIFCSDGTSKQFTGDS